MQIIKLERDDWNFFCPSTGMQVFKDDGEPNTAALRGMWCGEVPDLPMHLDAEIEPLWQAYLEGMELE